MNKPKLCKNDFQVMLRQMLAEALESGKSYIDLRAADLHTRVGIYPARGHSMPTCCTAMREEMSVGDDVLAEPSNGTGASLLIRYQLPRK